MKVLLSTVIVEPRKQGSEARWQVSAHMIGNILWKRLPAVLSWWGCLEEEFCF